jgi:hypothetical protein
LQRGHLGQPPELVNLAKQDEWIGWPHGMVAAGFRDEKRSARHTCKEARASRGSDESTHQGKKYAANESRV